MKCKCILVYIHPNYFSTFFDLFRPFSTSIYLYYRAKNQQILTLTIDSNSTFHFDGVHYRLLHQTSIVVLKPRYTVFIQLLHIRFELPFTILKALISYRIFSCIPLSKWKECIFLSRLAKIVYLFLNVFINVKIYKSSINSILWYMNYHTQ